MTFLFFRLFPIVWVILVVVIVFKTMSNASHQRPSQGMRPRQIHTTSNYWKDPAKDSAEEPVKASPQPRRIIEKSIHDKLNGEDQPKRGKLSRESREDEKNWF